MIPIINDEEKMHKEVHMAEAKAIHSLTMQLKQLTERIEKLEHEIQPKTLPDESH